MSGGGANAGARGARGTPKGYTFVPTSKLRLSKSAQKNVRMQNARAAKNRAARQKTVRPVKRTKTVRKVR